MFYACPGLRAGLFMRARHEDCAELPSAVCDMPRPARCLIIMFILLMCPSSRLVEAGGLD